MFRFFRVTLFMLILLSLNPGLSFATHSNQGDRTSSINSQDCINCHAGSEEHTSGPHGGYTDTTNKCSTCHTVHASEGNAQLLPGTTLTAVCMSCHDLTSTILGPYGLSSGMSTAGAHRVVGITFNKYTDTEGDVNETLTEGITTIPGGNGADGGSGTLNSSLQGTLSGKVFTCASCHTPHGVNSVQPYLGESNLKVKSSDMPEGQYKIYLTNRILKRNPNQKTIDPEPTQYGSQWCLSCHQGRGNNISKKHSHPVDESGPSYRFLDLANEGDFLNGATKDSVIKDGYILIDSRSTPNNVAEMRVDPRSNRQYSMTTTDDYTGKPRPDGYTDFKKYSNGPSCQQCHNSSRDVESPYEAGANPKRNNSPHISNNKGLLIEIDDDLCTNCHAPATLP